MINHGSGGFRSFGTSLAINFLHIHLIPLHDSQLIVFFSPDAHIAVGSSLFMYIRASSLLLNLHSEGIL